MVRYWKLMTLSLAIVLIMGTFYIRQVLIFSGLPDYVIRVQSGQASLAQNLVITGDYKTSNNHFQMRMTSKGTVYQTGGLIDSLTVREPVAIQTLQSRYPNFMRGKVHALDAYYEDAQMLAYAFEGTHGVAGQSFDLKVAILDKTNHNAVRTMNMAIPTGKSVYMNVQDVQRIGNDLKVVTLNGGINRETIHVYTIDVVHQKLVRDDVISSSDNNSPPNIVFNDQSPMTSNPVIVLLEQQKNSWRLYQYNLDSMKGRELKLPPQLKGQGTSPETLHGNQLYFEQAGNKKSTLYAYNVSTQTIDRKLVIDQSGSLAFQIQGGKVYILNPTQINGTPIEVINLKSGKIIFKGRIVPKKGGKPIKSTHVSLYSLEI